MNKVDMMFLVVIMIGLVMFLIGFSTLSRVLTVGGIVLVFASIPAYEIITNYQVKKELRR